MCVPRTYKPNKHSIDSKRQYSTSEGFCCICIKLWTEAHGRAFMREVKSLFTTIFSELLQLPAHHSDKVDTRPLQSFLCLFSLLLHNNLPCCQLTIQLQQPNCSLGLISPTWPSNQAWQTICTIVGIGYKHKWWFARCLLWLARRQQERVQSQTSNLLLYSWNCLVLFFWTWSRLACASSPLCISSVRESSCFSHLTTQSLCCRHWCGARVRLHTFYNFHKSVPVSLRLQFSNLVVWAWT